MFIRVHMFNGTFKCIEKESKKDILIRLYFDVGPSNIQSGLEFSEYYKDSLRNHDMYISMMHNCRSIREIRIT